MSLPFLMSWQTIVSGENEVFSFFFLKLRVSKCENMQCVGLISLAFLMSRQGLVLSLNQAKVL